MSADYVISRELQEELQRFLTGHNIALLNQNLRRQFIDYLDYELRVSVPLYFDTFLYPFNCLLDVLDEAAREISEFELTKKTAKQESITSQDTKEKVIEFIKAVLSPEKIFMLHGETLKDKQEYFDLLIVIPETAQSSFTHYEQVIAMANIDNAVINVSLHKSATLQKQLAEGHIYYSIACSKQNLVYDNGSMPLPVIKDEALELIKEKASDEFYTGFKKAESFLQGASNFYGENDITIAAFMLHQAVEITLRSLLMALLGNCPKTHYFKELQQPLKRCIPELHYLFSANEDEEKRLLHLLEKAYLETRYTGKFNISDNDFTLLTEGAEALHARAEELFNEKIKKIEH